MMAVVCVFLVADHNRRQTPRLRMLNHNSSNGDQLFELDRRYEEGLINRNQLSTVLAQYRAERGLSIPEAP